MASSSSSGDHAPSLFKVNSNSNGYTSNTNLRVERCPLCNQKTKAFYCKECVRNGNFFHSRMRLPVRYAEQKVRYLELRRNLQVKEKEVERLYQEKTQHLLLKAKIEEVKDRVELLRLVIDATKNNTAEVKTQNAEVFNINAARNKQLPLFLQRLSKVKQILHQYQEKIRDKKEQLAICEAQLKGVIRGNIRQLTRYIFPITEVKPARSMDTDPCSIDTVSAIAEASQTTYVRGRWIHLGTSHETQYQIVHPLLPGSGDYSAYNLLCMNMGSEVEDIDVEEQAGGFHVSAGLTYLTQFVNTLAFYLDVTLPKKLCYSEFCRNELSEQQFARRVTRLNTNVLYLCLSQNVPATLLRPTHTVSNLLALLNTQVADLGRQGSFEIDESLIESMEEGMEEERAEGSDSEDDTDTLSAEWETTGMGQIGQGGMGMGALGMGAGGIVSSAAASVMSLFRGFAGTQQK
ncbi:beclin 1-associated autophagy-related key regulator isoform X4 [Procambarus clarkii]|uniref:beclin 1-associated autophagy-related key regulator isoform X4 n=1 Tax=Procambarus clarkii TaxID=6728 RepID=UPI00374370F2